MLVAPAHEHSQTGAGASASFRLTPRRGRDISFPGMTREDILRNELIAQRDWLAEQIQHFTTQLRAVETALATHAPPAASLRAENSPPVPIATTTAASPAPPAPPAPVAAPAPPAVPPVPEDYRAKKTRKRGWVTARIEQLIDESGPTFSYQTLFEAYRAKWGWKSYPTQNSLGATLWKVVQRRGYPVVRQGGGRHVTIYQKTAPQ
jgi:hypothetical protein